MILKPKNSVKVVVVVFMKYFCLKKKLRGEVNLSLLFFNLEIRLIFYFSSFDKALKIFF